MTRDECTQRDAVDLFSGLRAEFAIPDGVIYLDGNSLGALPHRAVRAVTETVEDQWGRGLIASWNDAGWMDAPVRVGELIAPIIGAGQGQVVVTDSTTVNLYKALRAALGLRPTRRVVLSERENFPNDLYVAQGIADSGGCELSTVDRDQLGASLDESVAVLYLTHVDYRCGRMHDMAALTRRAHDVGALVVWDLSHSAGAVELRLDDWQVDFAVGCGYKYLNGGPGAPSFLFVARTHGAASSPIWGWMGHERAFGFVEGYEPGEGTCRFLAGTPPILAYAALEASLSLWRDIDRGALFDKGRALGETFRARLDAAGLRCVSPANPADRGSQVALAHPDASQLIERLVARGVIGDFRQPDVMRFGFAPMYLRHVDAYDAATVLVDEASRI